MVGPLGLSGSVVGSIRAPVAIGLWRYACGDAGIATGIAVGDTRAQLWPEHSSASPKA
jgi:hypothetical protein